jgi:hypothetical protein
MFGDFVAVPEHAGLGNDHLGAHKPSICALDGGSAREHVNLYRAAARSNRI